jgi:transposase
MYTKLQRAKNKNGMTREYLQIVESKRLKGKRYPQQRLICNLARVDQLDSNTRKMLLNIAKGILNSIGEDAIVIGKIPEIKKLNKKYYWGLITLCFGIWRQLRLDRVVESIKKSREIQFSLERVIFAIVVGRLYGQLSELSVYRWLKKVYCEDDFAQVELHHLYRGIDLLASYWDSIEDHLRWQVMDLFHQSAEVLFIDTTSVIYWGDGNGENTCHGYSRQRRGDKKQLVVGIALINGLPVGIEIEPGNTADREVMQNMLDRFKSRIKLREVCIVSDAGMVSIDDIRDYHGKGWQYLVRARSRENIVKQKVEEFHADKSQWELIQEGLYAKRFEVCLDRDMYEYLVVVYNTSEAERDRKVRETILAKLRSKVGCDMKGLVKNRGYQRYLKKGNQIQINEEKVESQSLWDGIWVLRTNRKKESLKEVIERYKELWRVEKIFKDMKNSIDVSPIYHSNALRIEGHIYATFLTLVIGFILQREAKKKPIHLTYDELIGELRELVVEWVKVGDKKILLRDELNEWQNVLFKRFHIKIPPSIMEISD